MPPSSMKMLATVTDLADRVGTIPDSEQARASACIQDASALVLREAGAFLATPAQDNPYDPYWQGASGNWWRSAQGSSAVTWDRDTVPADVWTVVLAAAARVYRNPEGLVSQTVGPITETRAATSVSAYLTPYERQLVRRAAGLSGMASVRVHRDDPLAAGAYITPNGSTEPVPWVAEWDWT